jgi:hypothetical protein
MCRSKVLGGMWNDDCGREDLFLAHIVLCGMQLLIPSS